MKPDIPGSLIRTLIGNDFNKKYPEPDAQNDMKED